jgi:hypothetical protein
MEELISESNVCSTALQHATPFLELSGPCALPYDTSSARSKFERVTIICQRLMLTFHRQCFGRFHRLLIDCVSAVWKAGIEQPDDSFHGKRAGLEVGNGESHDTTLVASIRSLLQFTTMTTSFGVVV